MNGMIWALQGLLAVLFFTAATTRAVRYDFARQQMAWVGAVPRPLLLFISAAEVAGAIGLVLPWLTGTDRLLTPTAAIGLASIQALAIFFHLGRHEPRNAAANVGLLAILLFVAAGRLAISPV